MDRGNTPSDYLKFLESSNGNKLLENLRDAVQKVKPFKIRAYVTFLIGLAVAILIFILFQNFWGVIFILPGIYFFYILSKEDGIIQDAQMAFNKGLNEFIFGENYLANKISLDYIPMGFMNGLPNFSGLFKQDVQYLGKYGNSIGLRVTRTFIEKKDGKEVKVDKTTDEEYHVLKLPTNSIIKNKKAVFYFDDNRFNLLESLDMGYKDKRTMGFTDTELDQWYEVSVGGLRDLFKENNDDKLLWTSIMTPYFENVIKALVVKYGQIHFVIDEGNFFAFVPRKKGIYTSVEYGKLDDKQYYSNWGSNPSIKLVDGKSSPKSALPYLYKVYLNKIMYAMTNYFFMDHNLVDPKVLQESRAILDYTINEYNNISTNDMQDEYESKL